MKFKILNTIGYVYTPEAKRILAKIGSVDYLNLQNQKQLEKKVSNYEIAVIGLGLNFDKKIIDAGKRLKVIATASTGTDHIDLAYAEKKGIVVLSLKNDREFLNSITGTAELAFLLTLALERNLFSVVNSVKNYCWSEKFMGHNLNGKTLGIIGLGRLGTMMARFGRAFGMKVVASDPYLKKKYFLKNGCQKVGFKTLLKTSDVISIHVHLDKNTENLFDKRAFKLMKETAILVNTSRGKIVNEEDLLIALKKKKIAGYGADVLSNELEFRQGFVKNNLIDYARKNSNILLTPHVGGVTFESREATDIFIAKKVVAFFFDKK